MLTARRILTILLLFVLVIPCGCHTIRKKFTRKKKYQKDPSVYVDFKDYPAKPPREVYADYYLFFRGWLDELIAAMRKGESFKRQRRALNESIMNLEQIISFFNPEGKEKIFPLYEEMLAVRDEVERNRNLNEIKRNAFVRKLEYVKRAFERDFNYTDAEQWME